MRFLKKCGGRLLSNVYLAWVNKRNMKTDKIIGLLIGIILSAATIGIALFIPKPKE